MPTPPPYPTRREARRLVRWFATAGAESRLAVAVGAGSESREHVEAEFGSSPMTLVHLDLAEEAEGDPIPAAFREHRGSHTALKIFVFTGLLDRVRAEGRKALDTLENNEALFRRPATWSLVWLDDPALVPLMARLAPRFHAQAALHPTFPDAVEVGATEAGDLLQKTLPPPRSGAAIQEQTLELLLDRGSLADVRRLLATRALHRESHLLLAGRADLLGGDVQSALAHFAAAASIDGPRHAEALCRAARVLAELGDQAAALRALARAEKRGLDPRAALEAAATRLVAERRGLGDATAAVAAARRAAEGDALLSIALGRLLAENGHLAPATEVLREAHARASLCAPRQLAAAELGLVLRQPPGAARDLLGPLIEDPATSPATAARACRGLARCDLDAGAFDQARAWIDRAENTARDHGLALEQVACGWERVALAAARADLEAVRDGLAALLVLARDTRLRPVELKVLAKQSHGFRLLGRLQSASDALDRLENLAYELTLPDAEILAHQARGDHLREIGVPGEARSAYERAAQVAQGIGDEAQARALRTMGSGA